MQVGETVVILGAGTIGLVTMLSCTASGAGRIIVADLIDEKLNKAKELGADYVINSGREDALEQIGKITDGEGADKVFETAGSPHTIAQTPFAVKRGGTIVLVGLAAVASGAIDIKVIVTHEFDLEHIEDAYNEAVRNKTDLIKAVIKIK